MKFSNIVREILFSTSDQLTPQEIRDHIKIKYPDYYGTSAHIRNVEKGHYKDIDHALLAQIYTLVGKSDAFLRDESTKPMKISLVRHDKSLQRTSSSSEGASVHKATAVRRDKHEDKVKEILANAEKYHDAYYKAVTFRGPSLYFHQRALETRQGPCSIIHLEYVYATLSAWGMHRMGKGGSKMQSFDKFQRSIESLQSQITEAQQFDFKEINDKQWAHLEGIFRGIDVMASGTSLVGNSKAMHHMLPNIVPPIDREYTLWYLRGNTNIKNDLEYEWQLMKAIISEFFIPVASDKEFQRKAANWMSKIKEYPWDTSVFKIVDNLIIGSKK